MAPRVHTLDDLAGLFGCNRTTLSRKRQGDRIIFDDGTYLRVIKIGRKLLVGDAELARFLGETGDHQAAAQ